jgi:transcriptional regulator with XRE-family HTH domain
MSELHTGDDWDRFQQTVSQVLSPEEMDEIDLQAKIMGEIVRVRKERHMTQRELEKATGINQSSIARMESGDTDSQLSTILRILRALGKTLAIVDLKPEDNEVSIKMDRATMTPKINETSKQPLREEEPAVLVR